MPNVIEGFRGVIAMETRAAVLTVKVVDPLTVAELAATPRLVADGPLTCATQKARAGTGKYENKTGQRNSLHTTTSHR